MLINRGAWGSLKSSIQLWK